MSPAELPLANSDRVALVDADDLAPLRQYRWILLGAYVVRQQRTRAGATTLIYIHRQLLAARPWEVVDHDDRNPLNNQRSNLVLCSQSENLAKRPSPRAGGHRGVYLERRGGRWRAQISVGGKNTYLGTRPTPELAARLYDQAARQAFGRFARLNFPDLGGDVQLELPGLDDPFDVPAPAARVDWYEIAQERRWNAARVISFGTAEQDTSDLDIPF